tara:strand:+ start:13725 stop:14375 length:651 start_codon:yes stop_codon:yes gene_type:complete
MKIKYLKSNDSEIKWKSSPNLTEYSSAIKIMNNYIKDIKENKSDEIIWLLEHPSVYTSGRSAKNNHILNTKTIPVINTSRGGQVTYHGPGQRIIYVMLNLNNREKDIRKYISTLEKWMIISLEKIDIKAYTIKNRIGLWVKGPKGESKIGAIGVKISKWITGHGISININPNLSYYNGIIPCGLKEYPITSIRELGSEIKMYEFDAIIKQTAKNIF